MGDAADELMSRYVKPKTRKDIEVEYKKKFIESDPEDAYEIKNIQTMGFEKIGKEKYKKKDDKTKDEEIKSQTTASEILSMGSDSEVDKAEKYYEKRKNIMYSDLDDPTKKKLLKRKGGLLQSSTINTKKDTTPAFKEVGPKKKTGNKKEVNELKKKMKALDLTISDTKNPTEKSQLIERKAILKRKIKKATAVEKTLGRKNTARK